MNCSHLPERGPERSTDGPGSCVRDGGPHAGRRSAALALNKTGRDASGLFTGLDEKGCAGFARNCLIARPPVGKGVRFVQLCRDRVQTWDSHGDVRASTRPEAALIDAAAPACCAIWPPRHAPTTPGDFQHRVRADAGSRSRRPARWPKDAITIRTFPVLDGGVRSQARLRLRRDRRLGGSVSSNLCRTTISRHDSALLRHRPRALTSITTASSAG